MKFITPPECGGQIVTHSYATCLWHGVGYVIEEAFDASDRTYTYRMSKLLANDRGEYWNGAPRNRRWRRITQAKFEAIRNCN